MKPRAGVNIIRDWQFMRTEIRTCRYCDDQYVPATPQQTITCGSNACKLAHDRAWRKEYRAKAKAKAASGR